MGKKGMIVAASLLWLSGVAIADNRAPGETDKGRLQQEATERSAGENRAPARAGEQQLPTEDRIRGRLMMDADLKDDVVAVEVSGREVTLRGNVDSVNEKRRAETIATASGATVVRNMLTVGKDEDTSEQVGETAEGAVDEAATELSDTWVTTKVKTALAADDRLEGTDISVDTNRDGVVTLTGTVPNARHKSRAVAVARKVEGVRQVKDALTIAPDRK